MQTASFFLLSFQRQFVVIIVKPGEIIKINLLDLQDDYFVIRLADIDKIPYERPD
jgi:hypothetical protein